MQRIPEPEQLMDDPSQAEAYAGTDFADTRGLFVDLLESQAGEALHGMLLDLGCGPADIPIALVRRHPKLQIDAVDGASAMLDQARRRIATDPSARQRICLRHASLPCAELLRAGYSYVVANGLLHHLDDPMVLWQTVSDCAAPGAQVLIMDLARPRSELAVDALVESHALNAHELVRRDFRRSLYAAYTVDEVRDQLRSAGLGRLGVETAGDRHLAVRGRIA